MQKSKNPVLTFAWERGNIYVCECGETVTRQRVCDYITVMGYLLRLRVQLPPFALLY